ncbi:unnamed protein product [Effrenium voratum]|uniref:Uncharacterized protein n=1 Tax=Effrenium voratum TaxID=2562239 RepID=A0AA36N4L2_9DINO|nr:unnamed protein product [Effrenium voratum]
MLVHNWTGPGVGPRRVSHLHLTSPERWMLRATLRFAMLVHSWTCPDVGPRRVSRTLPPQNSSQYNGHLLYKARLRSSRKTWGPSLPKAEVARAQGVPSEHTMLLRRLKIYRFVKPLPPSSKHITECARCFSNVVLRYGL